MAKTALMINKVIPVLKSSVTGLTKKELARKLDVSVKTAGRYLSELKDMRLGLTADNGKDSRYRIVEESTGITLEDINLIEIVKTELKAIGNLQHEERLGYLSGKLNQLRLQNESDEVLNLEMSGRFQVFMNQGMDYSTQKSKIERLYRAIKNREALKLEYRKLDQKVGETKEYYPLAFSNRLGRLYLIVQSPRNAERIFILYISRIKNITSTGRTFTVPEGFTVEKYFKSSMTAWHSNEPPVHLVIRIREHWLLEFLNEMPLHPSKTLTKKAENDWRLTLDISWGDDVLSWILGFGDGFEVIEPVSVRKLVQEAGKKLVKLYSGL